MKPATPRSKPKPDTTEAYADNMEECALDLMNWLLGDSGMVFDKGDIPQFDRLDKAIAAYQRHRGEKPRSGTKPSWPN